MAVVSAEAFPATQTATTSDWYASISGSVTVDTGTLFNGDPTLKHDTSSPAASSFSSTKSGSASASGRIQKYIRFSSLPPSGQRVTLVGGANSSITVVGAFLDSNGHLQFRSGATDIGSPGSKVLSVDTWYRICISYSITSTTNWAVKIYIGEASSYSGVLELNLTNADGTLAGTGVDRVTSGMTNGVGANVILRTVYGVCDDVTDLTDVHYRFTCKKPTTTTTNNFDGTVGTGAVNERPVSATNGKTHAATSDVDQDYEIEALSAGDHDLTSDTIVANIAWIYSELSSLTGTPACKIIHNGARDASSWDPSSANTPTVFTIVSNSASYPKHANGKNIGTSSTIIAADTKLWDCGVIIVYTPPAGGDVSTSVSMSAVATMTAAGKQDIFGSVSMGATAAFTAGSLVKYASSVSMGATATFTAGSRGLELVNTLQDNFNDNSRDTEKWNVGNLLSGFATTGVTVSETNQHLEITPTHVGASTYSGYISRFPYSLIGNELVVQVVQAATGSPDEYDTIIQLVLDNNNYLQMSAYQGGIEWAKRVSGTYTAVGNIPYNSTTHKWWRIRESGGTIFYDTSADGGTWTNRGSTTVPFSLIALKVTLNAGYFNTNLGSTTAAAIFDDVNLASAATSVSMAATATFTAASLVSQATSVSMAATAAFSAAGKPTQLGSTSMSAVATMTAAGKVNQLTSVSMSAVATMTAAGKQDIFASVSMSAVGAFTAASLINYLASVSMSAVATMVADLVLADRSTSVSMAATAIFTAVGTAPANSSVSMAATATFTAASLVRFFGSVSMSAVGSFTAVPTIIYKTSVALSAVSAFVAAGKPTQLGSVSMAATGAFTSVSKITYLIGVSLGATATFTAASFATYKTSASLSAVAIFTAAGRFIVSGVSMSALAIFTVVGVETKYGAVVMDAVAILIAEGFVTELSYDITLSRVLVSTGKRYDGTDIRLGRTAAEAEYVAGRRST